MNVYNIEKDALRIKTTSGIHDNGSFRSICGDVTDGLRLGETADNYDDK